MKIFNLLIVLLLLLTTGCSAADGPASREPTLTPTQTLYPTATPQPPLPPPTQEKAVEVSLSEASSMSSTARVDFGLTARIELSMEPVLLELTRDGSGKVLMASTRAWANAPLKEMQVCFSLGRACDGARLVWVPFQAKVEMDYPVDWLGSRQVFVTAQVRDAGGANVPIYMRYYYNTASQVQTQFEIIGQVNTATPPDEQPAPVQTALAAAHIAFPVSGSVVIEGGKCCAGGTAGSTIQLNVAFAATSPSGKVSEMRVRIGGGCQKDAAALDAPWEPFASSRSYSASLAINWVGWTISAQYRDEQGNLSPVYCDDISLEGSPPQGTP